MIVVSWLSLSCECESIRAVSCPPESLARLRRSRRSDARCPERTSRCKRAPQARRLHRRYLLLRAALVVTRTRSEGNQLARDERHEGCSAWIPDRTMHGKARGRGCMGQHGAARAAAHRISVEDAVAGGWASDFDGHSAHGGGSDHF